jgi:hypothetical protein
MLGEPLLLSYSPSPWAAFCLSEALGALSSTAALPQAGTPGRGMLGIISTNLGKGELQHFL